MSKYFYHGVDDLETLIIILEEGAIKSPRLLGKTLDDDFASLGLNGLDYICLCNKLENYSGISGHSSFDMFILDECCLIISDDIDAIKTKPIEWFDDDMGSKLNIYRNITQGIHVSFCSDEYRVKDMISIDKIIGIGIPFRTICGPDLLELRELLVIAQALGLDIVDSSDELFIEKYEVGQYNRKDIVKKIKGLGL